MIQMFSWMGSEPKKSSQKLAQQKTDQARKKPAIAPHFSCWDSPGPTVPLPIAVPGTGSHKGSQRTGIPKPGESRHPKAAAI